MLDGDLAHLYEVEIKDLNRAVKRNIDRFPEKFTFQLTKEEIRKAVNYLLDITKPSKIGFKS